MKTKTGVFNTFNRGSKKREEVCRAAECKGNMLKANLT
jgi:hypothetical protein